MKNIVRKLIEYLGYDIIRLDQKEEGLSKEFFKLKYNDLITEIVILYQELVFPEFPKGNTSRVGLMAELQGTQISEAIYIINFLNKTFDIKGDICEFGIAQGATSALIANEISSSKKNLWLFDSFKGLPKPTEKDLLKDDIFNLGSMLAYQGEMACSMNMVIRRLSEIAFPQSRIKIVPGFIEETLKCPNLPESVSFAYIDLDFYEPIKIALEFLDDKLSNGGFIIVDDYDFFSSGVKTAVDEFMDNRANKFRFSKPIESVGHFCILERFE